MTTICEQMNSCTWISTKVFPQKFEVPSSPWQRLVSVSKCVAFGISTHCPIKPYHSSQNKATAVAWIDKHTLCSWISETNLQVPHPSQCFQPANLRSTFHTILWELSAVSIATRHTYELGTPTVLLYSQLIKPAKFTLACFQ